MKLRVHFEPAEVALEVAAGDWLVDGAEAQARLGLPLSCRAASCGVCRVVVAQGGRWLQPPDPTERRVLEALRAGSDERLGCQLRATALEAEAEAGAQPAVRLRVLTPVPSEGGARC